MAKQSTDFALLGLLSIEPMSGYDIRQNFQESLNFFWNESYGQIYPALKRLLARGFITAAPGGQNGRAVKSRVIWPKRRADRSGEPIKRNVGEHAVPADRPLDIAAAIGPGAEFFHDPRRKAGR